MARRQDGIETRDRILQAGCRVFAEKGYSGTTVADICSQAGTNVASVNYHFGSKDELYAEVWRHAWDQAVEAYPPDGGVSPGAPAEERLRAAIRSLVGKTVDAGRIGDSGRLLLREIVNPTDVIKNVKRDIITPQRRRMHELVGELLGPQATHEHILLCSMSIVHQAFALGIRLFTGRIPPDMRLDMPAEELVEALTDHITRFSLGGIEAVRKGIEQRCI